MVITYALSARSIKKMKKPVSRDKVRVVKKVYIVCVDPYNKECPSYEEDTESLSGHCSHVEKGSGIRECKFSWCWSEEEREAVERG
jgi:hypothetical protein